VWVLQLGRKIDTMKHPLKLTLACAALLAACGGGGDLLDRLDLAQPAVRLVNASPLDPSATLYRDGRRLDNASTQIGYKFESNYFDVSEQSQADWEVRDTNAGRTLYFGTTDVQRGNKYSFVVLQTSATTSGVYAINDPYNKSLSTNETRLRVVNGAYTTSSVDVYLNAPGTDISAVSPFIAGADFKSSQPLSGGDSRGRDKGDYQVRVTTANTKTVLFAGTLSFGENQDLLLIPVANSASPTRVKLLVVVEGADNRQISELTDTP
jgi:Domain of unknown function (DUF4397)